MPPYSKNPASHFVLLSLALAFTVASDDSPFAADLSGGAASNAPSSEPADSNGFFQTLHDWNVVIGGGASLQPKYEGSDEYEVSPIPFISAQYGDYLTIDPRGVGYKAFNHGPFSFELNLGYQKGRDEDDGYALRGMGDIDWGVTIGGKATADLGPVDLFLSVEKILGGSDGLLAEAGVSVDRPISRTIILGAEASATFADGNYMQSYFGVDAGQSVRSGHARYGADAGIKSVGFGVSATWLMTQHWVLSAEQKLDFLTGDAADSPI